MKESRVNIVTLGCSKNTVDSQKLMRQLTAGGYSVTADSPDPSDIVIINTCGFILDAREESIDTIISHAEAIKRRGRGKLFVMGCLSERYRTELEASIPEVDSWFGVNRPEEVISHLGLAYRPELTGERILPGPKHYAYLKISEGCDRTCAFCAIPDIRGRYTSVPLEELAAEASYLTSTGVKELILIAQDLTLYGTDIYGKQMLPELVRQLSDTEGLEWIRLHYLYPSGFPYEILEMMQDNRKICRYIDIPIQHISDNVLRRMRREHSGEETRRLLNDIRRIVPDAAVRTTVIAGHPGETEEDFSELLRFVEEYRFDRLGAFRYSHEENTHAWLSYADDFSEKEKERRVSEIMELQQRISGEINASKRGEVVRVIIDRKEGLFHVGRTQFDSPEVDQEVLITTDRKIEPGTFIDVKITGSTEFDLYAEETGSRGASVNK
ncbi:MAG: 30S ribosomal protein S12 methylthiotransferase RimO [Bacteroidales bacterium]|jgi:ribosomal protein S12 methylthiotransferase|nr:30S ribosomal protein S12 methylthiotransferase RimO [Bacteroidales bacterium]